MSIESTLFTVIDELITYIKYLRGKRKAISLAIDTTSLDPIRFNQGVTSMILTDIQKVAAAVEFFDAAGNPTTVDGAPVWASSDESVVSVVASEDGLSAVISAVGPLGNAQVSVRADADKGEGVVELIGTVDIEVVGSQAVVANVNLGAPENK